jgi:aminopeptidase N
LLEQKNPDQFREVLEKYRHDLLSQNKDGEPLRDAGPVTLGLRLESSHFPQGYDEISYERGTWLFHMLRTMLRDATLRNSTESDATASENEVIRTRKGHAHSLANSNEPFFQILRKIRERYAGKTLSTEQLIQAFEEDLPRPLWYEKRPKLDWFLESWIEGTAIPSLEARDIRITDKPGGVTITGIIVQKDAPDDLVTAIPVYGSTTDKTLVFLGEVLADGHETTFRLAAPSTVHKIVLDPNQTILTAPK